MFLLSYFAAWKHYDKIQHIGNQRSIITKFNVRDVPRTLPEPKEISFTGSDVFQKTSGSTQPRVEL